LRVEKIKKPTCSEAIENAVLAEYRVAVCADQHTGLSVPEDVVLFQQTYGGKYFRIQRVDLQKIVMRLFAPRPKWQHATRQ